MAKTKISEYDATAANNTDIDSINIAEGMAPSNVNNAIRELMAHLKDGLGAGTPVYLDATNNRVGIGTTTPSSAVDIASDASSTVPTLTFTDTDTATSVGQSIGRISFDSDDASPDAAGERAFIKGYLVNGTDYGIDFGAMSSGGSPSTTMSIVGSKVGIGTIAPSSKLSVEVDDFDGIDIKCTTASKDPILSLTSPSTNYWNMQLDASSSDDLQWRYNNSTKMMIDSSGNVGIGTSSPSQKLHLVDSDPKIQLSRTSDFYYGQLSADGFSAFTNTNGSAPVIFKTATTERMRIDSSGNLLVGKTSVGSNNTGFQADQYGAFAATVDGGLTAVFNRKTSDGHIVQFRKDGTAVGSIGNSGARPYICSTGHGLYFGSTATLPTNGSGAVTDNTYDLGTSSYRWDDIYATNGTIQTSDQNEKQQIASLTDAEITAAKAISKLFKTFKWNDSVTEKGDAARTHTGVIAQEVEQAMTDAGLNAGDYAFFISTTWWETQTEVPAVEAVDEVLDEDGNVITEALEAQEAYTRTDTYDTAAEAPEGATERNRKGIRYPQLLSFIGAATEQRLASIESRLDALESA